MRLEGRVVLFQGLVQVVQGDQQVDSLEFEKSR